VFVQKSSVRAGAQNLATRPFSDNWPGGCHHTLRSHSSTSRALRRTVTTEAAVPGATGWKMLPMATLGWGVSAGGAAAGAGVLGAVLKSSVRAVPVAPLRGTAARRGVPRAELVTEAPEHKRIRETSACSAW